MRTVEEIVVEIDAAIADSGPSCARHHDAPGREPALALLARLGVNVTPAYPGVRDSRVPVCRPSPSADDTIVMEVIR